MYWEWIVGVVYLIILVAVCLRIIYETRSTSKTMAYVLFCIFVPVAGIVFYIVFGVNYWRRKLYSKKILQDEQMLAQLKKDISLYTEESLQHQDIEDPDNTELAAMLMKDLKSPLTR